MPVYVIAEAGSVADGSIGNMLALVDMAADCGADAFKGQDHRGQSVSGPHPSERVDEWRAAYYDRTAFTQGDWLRIRERCTARGLALVVSPFSEHAVECLSGVVDAWKIASGEVTNLPLLEAVKATGLPVYLSSGMTAWWETSRAVRLLPEARLCIMHCTSEYPCAPERVGLNVIQRLGEDGFRIGLSDHTLGFAASLAAITLGATVIERHVTLSRRCYGSDAAHSLEPEEFARFVREVRELDRMLTSPVDKDVLIQTPEIQRIRETFLHRSET